MKRFFKYGLKLYGKMAVANIMCFIVLVSLTFLSTFIFTSEIGYKVSGVDSNGQIFDELYVHYYEDGKDVKFEEYEVQGYELSKTGIRSSVSGGALTFLQIVSQITGLGLLISFIYPMFWDIGNKESNAVKFGRISEDKLCGLKAGLVAIIPVSVALIFIIATKNTICSELSVTLFKFINSTYYGITDMLTGHVSLFKNATVSSLIIVLVLQLIIPVIAQVGYTLGYKDFSVKERLVYKEKI